MMVPNKSIVKQIKQYDDKLYVKWNNIKHYFEVWRKMLWGHRLITPVVSNIYNPGKGTDIFCPLDHRILAWLYGADSQRKGLNKNWKWRTDKRFREIEVEKRIKTRKLFRDIAAENYLSVNNELLGISALTTSNENWVRPDMNSTSKKN